jgi:hypothetical protein
MNSGQSVNSERIFIRIGNGRLERCVLERLPGGGLSPLAKAER